MLRQQKARANGYIFICLGRNLEKKNKKLKGWGPGD